MAFLPSQWETGVLSISDVRPDEVALIARLHQSRSAIGEVDRSFVPVSVDEYREYLEASVRGERESCPFRLQIFRLDGEPCGYFHSHGSHPFGDAFFISMFLISPEFERRGIGSLAANGISSQAAMLGYKRAMLSVFLANTNALSFWVAQGFDKIHKFRRFESTGPPDRLILERQL